MEDDDYADNETARLCAASPVATRYGAIPHMVHGDDNDEDDTGDVTPYGYAGYGNYYEALQDHQDDDHDSGCASSDGGGCLVDDPGATDDAVPDDIGDLLPAYSSDDGDACSDRVNVSDASCSDDTYDLAFDAFYAASLVAPLGDEQDMASLGHQASDAVAAAQYHVGHDDDVDGTHNVAQDDNDIDVNLHVDDVNLDDDGGSCCTSDESVECAPDIIPLRVAWPLDAHPFAAYVDDASHSDDDGGGDDKDAICEDDTWREDGVTNADDAPSTHPTGTECVFAAATSIAGQGADNDDGDRDDDKADAVSDATGKGDDLMCDQPPHDHTIVADEINSETLLARDPDVDGEPTPLSTEKCLLVQDVSVDVTNTTAGTDNGQDMDAVAVDDRASAQPQQVNDTSSGTAAVEPDAADAAGCVDDDQKAISSFEPIAAPIQPVQAPVAVVEPEPDVAPPAQAAAPAAAEGGSWWSPWSWWSGKSAPAGTASAASDARLKAPGLVLTKADLDSVRLRPVAARGPRPLPVAEPAGVLGQLLGLFGGVGSSTEPTDAGVDLSSPPSVRALVAAMENAGRTPD
ncbi:hypothetical protein psal_cds_671 [Pandoravirus salinus]|uniref:RNase E G incomplete domain containing protein n=1 Tax=Pandoravirus salinus TaxID=1349410 RepID=S4VYP8_9VIRU|nr:hypothetical protein psal_cds_671 [Pandoravirus salinus]AGO84596.2 hypothetical protein psal_cds_671 [Pandoravirus salinus]